MGRKEITVYPTSSTLDRLWMSLTYISVHSASNIDGQRRHQDHGQPPPYPAQVLPSFFQPYHARQEPLSAPDAHKKCSSYHSTHLRHIIRGHNCRLTLTCTSRLHSIHNPVPSPRIHRVTRPYPRSLPAVLARCKRLNYR